MAWKKMAYSCHGAHWRIPEPSFVLGRTEANGMVKGVKLIRGAQGLPSFTTQIQAFLDDKADKPVQR